ncbi:MAG: O-acetylhomoserine aminocarboxypropyltransferase/cysteine synthase [Lentisphaeraceae bacterium]|nr:O-acetylhomoserine aminocarboxypropyltransferase/cysteine synthase [Lentisphaeraceae bacterium]
MSLFGDSTNCLHAGQEKDSATNARAVPIYQTSSFMFDSTEHAANLFELKEFGNVYTRLMNPTSGVLEQRIAALEGGVAGVATSSGMAAIFLAVTSLVKAGDHIISSASLYGGSDTLFRYALKRFGIETTFIDDMDESSIESALKENTKLIYGETIGNPKGDILNFEPISLIAQKYNIPFMVDNTFAPVLCKPIEQGANIVVHSCTKWIGGHGTSIGGCIVDAGNFDWSSGRFPEFTEPDPSYHGLKYWETFGNLEGMGNIAYAIKCRVEGLRNVGSAPSPFNSFLFLQGMETLPLRMEKHNENALKLASWLKNHELVDWVNFTGLEEHPSHGLATKYLKGGFGSVFGFGPKGGFDAAKKFIESCKLASHLANVGDAKTLVLHPASTSHQQLDESAQKACGLTPDFVRVSVGIENIDDILADFDQALKGS